MGGIMAYNMYSQIGKVRKSLKERGFETDIPFNEFCSEMMLVFGMGRKKAIEWIYNFSDVKLITIKDDHKVNFV